jgi:cytidylate kinase
VTEGRPFIVAIDGPAGAGKSSVAKLLARRLGFSLVDTGAIYRCVALLARRSGVEPEDDAGLGALLGQVHVHFEVAGDENRVFLGGEDVSAEIRTPEISMGASQVSQRPVVRQGLLSLQRRLALESPRGAVLEGRDIGTVVFPDADVKFFLQADPAVRARRRYDELLEKGVEASLESVLADQIQRDRADASREVAPLKPAPDAIQVDTSSLPLSEVVQALEAQVRERRARRP